MLAVNAAGGSITNFRNEDALNSLVPSGLPAHARTMCFGRVGHLYASYTEGVDDPVPHCGRDMALAPCC